MPELPEVETVRMGLVPVMEGRRIDRAAVNRPDLRWPFPPRMAERLQGARVLQLRRRSKYILADLDSAETLLIRGKSRTIRRIRFNEETDEKALRIAFHITCYCRR